jgi:hypothetical protein
MEEAAAGHPPVDVRRRPARRRVHTGTSSPRLELQPASDWCQRWLNRRPTWQHPSAGGFDRRRYDVAELAETSARAFVVANHYSGTFPAASLCAGLFDGVWLVGVAVLSVPVQAKVLTDVFPDLAPYHESLELGRLVLADQVPANAETWFLARVWELARRRGLRGVVMFSDPIARCTLAGDIVFPGHVGVIYQAASTLALGRGTPRTQYWLPDGRVLNARALQKVRSDEVGTDYVERMLLAAGAQPRRRRESGRDWLRRALIDAEVRRIRHPGCYRYAFALDRRVHVAIEPGRYPCPCPACRARELAPCS